ncbi:uncharacterized protein K02A2.6-like [Malaya genurostris]|uniref:uncharacterized protein K02A2.6-like n=1 Tax=Malaya genurostris TaxID=325434 RepID=UPI0026F3B8F7|nr:uncharacterized protein K02A2.6-like [Malaya genurostris]
MAQFNMAATIEPYRKGSSFTEWVERLGYFFLMNDVKNENKKAHFITLSGPAVFSELKLLFPNNDLANVAYEDMISKLKSRFDKTESDIIQRFKFHNRLQMVDETAEDYVLAVKLQAEFCGFGDFKQAAVRDRIISGIRDKALQQRLLNEEKLTLESTEKLIATWEIAGTNAKTLGINSKEEQIASLIRTEKNPGFACRKLAAALDSANKIESNPSYNRVSVKSRLGGSPYNKNWKGSAWNKKVHFRPAEWRRGEEDQRTESRFCDFCGIRGHLKRKCFKLKNLRKESVKFVDSTGSDSLSKLMDKMKANDSDSDDEKDNSGDLECMHIFSIHNISNPCLVDLFIEGKSIKMEVDCGSSVTVMGKYQYFSIFTNKLKKSSKQLIVVNGAKLVIEGEATVRVVFKGKKAFLKLLIPDCDNVFTPLLGRPWLDVFFPEWRNFFSHSISVNNVSLDDSVKCAVVQSIKSKFANVFTKDFSTPIKGYEADLVLKEDVPIFKKAYDVPYRLREKVLDYLTKLENEKVITPIKQSEWASPVIVVMKKNNEIRLVIDCKVSINKCIIQNTYPLPVAQDLFAGLAGCKVFCALDLEGAYTQLSLSNRSRKFMVINTIKGLFTYNRLPQGASSSASIFQHVMDQVLKGLENVFCYLDDVLIAGTDMEDCIRKVYLVLDRLSEANIKVNLEKCKFFVAELGYLGHVISEMGLLPCPEKVLTIQKAKIPKNVTELKSFLGLINFYNKFIPHLSSKLYHLYNLLRNNVKFEWNDECSQAFEAGRKALLATKFLEFFDPKKPLVVVSDASGYGLGGVIAHLIDGIEKPICFTSFSLNNAQKSYPILHLEALALVCTIKKFHKYLYGQRFTVYTDHKPLVGIFGKEGKNSILVTRLQRYVLELSIYEFDIQYRQSAKMGNADFCSRFPLEQEVPRDLDTEFIRSVNFGKELPIDSAQIALETKNDSFLQNISKFMINGWPKRFDKSYVNVFSNQHDLGIIDGCLLYKDRMIIPHKLQSGILKLLHANHAGIVKMKQLARRYVFWFGINKDIESFVASCDACNGMVIVHKPKITSKWIPTTRPFSRIHIDFFHFLQNTFLLIVDSYSKWIEIEWMKKGTDSNKVLKKLVAFFARFGLPDVLVSDGGPPFNSYFFASFLERQGIKVFKSPPYNPTSNGQAERLVRTTKEVLKRFLLDQDVKDLDLEDQISFFLFNYRNCCSTLDGHFPAERIFSYAPKTLLDLLNPLKSYKKQLISHTYKDNLPKNNDDVGKPTNVVCPAKESTDPLDSLMVGDEVWYKNHNPHNQARWIKASYSKKYSHNVFQIFIGSVEIMAHRHQLRVVRASERNVRPNVVISTLVSDGSKGYAEDIVSEEEFCGFPEDDRVPGTKRKQHEAGICPTQQQLRRSKRVRRAKLDNRFEY